MRHVDETWCENVACTMAVILYCSLIPCHILKSGSVVVTVQVQSHGQPILCVLLMKFY